MADPPRVSPLPPKLPPPFDQIDQAQVTRHAQLCELWRHLSVQELLTDMNVLHQVLYFRAHRERVVADAKIGVLQGAGHDCEEWPNPEGRCELCGGSVMFGPGR